MNDRIESMEEILRYEFKDKKLLRQALTHSSYAANQNTGNDNERLEFLGDAVLELSVSDYLYRTYPDLHEGHMTRMRACLVCENALYQAAKRLNIGEYLLMSYGEEQSGGREKPTILSDAIEALIAALYIDGGFDAARKFIMDFTRDNVESNAVEVMTQDYKTALQEYVQRKYRGSTIRYKVAGEEGPDHKKTFHMQVLMDNEVLGEGHGGSKQSAGQEAARNALKRLNKRDKTGI